VLYLVFANYVIEEGQNVNKTKLLVFSGDQNAGRKYTITFGDSYCEILEDFVVL
jgi:hypothetical protein